MVDCGRAGLLSDLVTPDSSLDIRYTPRRGCMYARNTYDFTTASPCTILFFRQALPYVSSVDSLDYEAVNDEWERCHAANNATLPRVGIYFPFEGQQLYETVRQLGWGSVGLRAGIPRYLRMTRTKEILSEIAIPSYVLSLIQLDDFHIEDVEVQAWVPYARVQKEPYPTARVHTEVKEPTVEDANGLRGKLVFDESDGGGRFRRLPTQPEAPRATKEHAIADVLYDINSLGLRVWPIVPLGLLSNDSLEAEWIRWRETNIALAREVAQAQSTSVLAVGATYPERAKIPRDFVVVSVEDAGEWRFC